MQHAAVLVGDDIYVFGGAESDSQLYSLNISKLEDTSNSGACARHPECVFGYVCKGWKDICDWRLTL